MFILTIIIGGISVALFLGLLFILYIPIATSINYQEPLTSNRGPFHCPQCLREDAKYRFLQHERSVSRKREVVHGKHQTKDCHTCGGSGVIDGGPSSFPHPLEPGREMPTRTTATCPTCKGCGDVSDGYAPSQVKYRKVYHDTYTYRCMECKQKFETSYRLSNPVNAKKSNLPSEKITSSQEEEKPYFHDHLHFTGMVNAMLSLTFCCFAWYTYQAWISLQPLYAKMIQGAPRFDFISALNYKLLGLIGKTLLAVIAGWAFGLLAGGLSKLIPFLLKNNKYANAILSGAGASLLLAIFIHTLKPDMLVNLMASVPLDWLRYLYIAFAGAAMMVLGQSLSDLIRQITALGKR